MVNIKTWLIHKKIQLVGDDELEKNGKFIPCLKCNKLFFSYYHYSRGGCYDSKCKKCTKR